MGFRAGRTFSDGDLKSGIVKTLLDYNAIEKLDDLDTKKNIKPSQSSSKPGRSKGSSKSRGKRSGSDDSASD